MKERTLFCTPTSRGLLSGLLAGIATLISFAIEQKYSFDTEISYNLFWCLSSGVGTLLSVGLPAMLANRQFGVLGTILVWIFAFLLFVQWLPVIWSDTLSPFILQQYFTLAQQAFAEITTGILLGTVLVKAYRRPDLRRRAMLWGALAGIPNALSGCAISYSYLVDLEPLFSRQGTAVVVMSFLTSNVLFGVIAAVPFDHEAKSPS